MENENWIDVASAADLKARGAMEVVLEGNIIALFNVQDVPYALDGLCAHQGGPIAKGQISETDRKQPCVTCPWHGWQYELATGIQTVNRQPLQRTFPVRERDGRIEIRLDG
ncbi:Rieske (2Fe-2S) protein [Roseiconus nitratireducens]|uniref:Rieske (2Fe-2S) protein n=1 Tax=Roseiconus nitratireducens TaxID=2605748 RepID=A0A5M6D252_9BACT|nr:Rieske (2Fe-2S) protein [Roseiconus nitratireducens]KAA5541413.1 Rieske (2Fe-2S) protein [Roseiconus nitratireducens]